MENEVLSVEDVATMLGYSVGTVRNKLTPANTSECLDEAIIVPHVALAV